MDTPASSPASSSASLLAGRETKLPEKGSIRALLSFLKRPVLPDRASGITGEALRGIGRLYLVDLMAMSVLGVIAVTALALGFVFPGNELTGIELTPQWIAVIVLGAPLTEEIIFRGGLSGKAGHIAAAIFATVAILLLPTAFYAHGPGVSETILGMGAVLLGLAAASLWFGRKRGPMRWFAFAFPVIFWLVTLAFALIHLANYTEGALWVLLPLVVPQFIAGTLFGYARVQYGLWAAMLLHAMHNGTAVALVLLFGQVMPEGMPGV